MQAKKWFVYSQFVTVGQLGLSLIMPLLICLFLCYLLMTRFSVGGWVFIPGFFFGLGGSAMTAWKVYLSITKKQKKNQTKQGRNEVSFNTHY